jgi:hypothetical protein
MADHVGERFQKYKYIVQVVIALLFGIGIIYGAAFIKDHPISHDVASELGIAIVIAALVTLMYETYAREVLARETMARIVESVMGDMFDTELWVEMRKQLVRRTAVRREFSVRLRVERDERLPPHQAVLWMSISYRVFALRQKTDEVKLYHYLDRFMYDAKTGLPRFTHISVGDEVIDPRKLHGRFAKDVDVRGWSDGVPVVVERREIVYTPGSYSLLMSDLTAVEIVKVEDVPADVAVEINWTLDKPHPVQPFDACSVKRMLLPGHAIEIRLIRSSQRDDSAGTGTAA